MNHLSDQSRLYITKFIPLQWSEFRRIYGCYRLFIQYNTLIETPQTSLIGLDHKRVLRLELIKTLSDDVMTNKEISEFLNSMGVKTPKGKEYYPKLIWVTLKKYRKRLERNSPYKIIQTNECLMLQPIKILSASYQRLCITELV